MHTHINIKQNTPKSEDDMTLDNLPSCWLSGMVCMKLDELSQ